MRVCAVSAASSTFLERLGLKAILASLLLCSVGSPFAKAQELDFWTTDVEPERVEVIEGLLRKFEAANPGVTVKLTAVEENDVPTAMTMGSVVGGLPNLLHAGSEQTIAFGEQGLVDHEGTVAVLERIGADRFYDASIGMHRAQNGQLHAIPFYGWVQGIWYRKDWFDQAGLAAPTTWDAIRDAASTLHDPENGRFGILIGSQSDAYAEQAFTHFALSNGVRQFSPDGRLVFNTPETVETLSFYMDLLQYGPPGPNTWRARDYFLQGRLAMMVYSTFIMDDLALQEVAASSLTGENFADLDGADFDGQFIEKTGMVPVIEQKQPAGYGVITSLSLPRADPLESQVAQDLAVFLLEERNYVAWLHTAPGGMNPVLSDVVGSDVFLNDPQGVFARYGQDRLRAIFAGLEDIQSFSVSNGQVFPEAGKIFTRQVIPQMIVRAAWEGQSAEQAVEWAEQEMRAIIGQ